MARNPRRRPTTASAGDGRMTIRHYCQGLGDSHLLTIWRPDGTPFRMLIDCGLHSIVRDGNARIDKIAADIKAESDGHIDVLVVTHEHWDHVSGFSTAAKIFKQITVGEVWMPWTENPDDPLAAQLDRYRGQALAALQMASARLAGEPSASPYIANLREGLDAVLGFHFGADGDRVRTARNAAAALAGGKPPIYLGPDSPPISIEGIPDLRLYVLGPPRDRALLKLEERETEMYRMGARSGWPMERMLSAALDEDSADTAAPFDVNLGHVLTEAMDGRVDAVADFIAAHYSGPATQTTQSKPDDNLADQSWRRIDADWLGIAAELAIQLDSGINNTSLVLAFEFTDTHRVALFPGDAQIGSWLSWTDHSWPVETGTVAATDLLARTVYLKVSHHGSRNATPSRAGLELMTSPDLSAFVPVSELDAKKARWHEMPFGTILSTLSAKTAGRVIRADDHWLTDAAGVPGFVTPSGSIRALRNKGEGWVEVDIA